MQPSLEMKGISKKFGDFYALKEVNFKAYPGCVNALVGENGAGKSTLMKILSGVHQKDNGCILVDGEEVDIKNPVSANRLGIYTVYQELAMASDLSVAENMFIGPELISNKFGFINKKEIIRETEKILEKFGLDVDPNEKVRNLSIAQQQMIEIARAVRHKSKVIVFDEPTAMLAAKEAETLFEVINKLKEQDITIIYISHRLEEIFNFGGYITVLKDGELAGMDNTENLTVDKTIHMMVGHSIESQYPKESFDDMEKKEILRVESLNRENKIKNVSFSAYSGEILGFAGLVGSGRTEIMRAIFGADEIDSGEIYLEGEQVNIKNVRTAIDAGIAYLPEDRKNEGLVLKHSIADNISIVNLDKYCNKGKVISRKEERCKVEECANKLRIKAERLTSLASSLSGGNQQKVVIAKWMLVTSKVVIMDEPTRGIDVGAKVEVYNVMNEFVRDGKAVIMVSSEMPELIGMCDRIIVVNEGRLSGEFTRDEVEDDFNQDNILKSMMLGGNE